MITRFISEHLPAPGEVAVVLVMVAVGVLLVMLLRHIFRN